jgi:hypothetical protein
MTRFVERNNGTFRRIRGTRGGNTAWKQHVDESGWDNGSERREKLARIQDQLDTQALTEVVEHRPVQRTAHRHTAAACHVQSPAASAAPRRPEPASTAKVAPRFRVVWEGKGTMRAVAVN